MKRKLVVICLSIFLLTIFSSNANAQTAASSPSILKDRMQMLKDTKKDEFRAKLQTIKDERKKLLVERIDAKLTNMNTKHTDRFAQVLSNLQVILDKISVDVDKTSAQTAIDAAKLAVENQAAKTYTITISTETNLRLDVGKVTSQLRQDLSATHKAVIDAKQAVQLIKYGTK